MASIAAGLVRLLELAAKHPDGHLPLFEGHLESVAALYQVHPSTVLHLRACLEDEAGRASAAEILGRACLAPVPALPPAAPRALTCCEAVLARAGAHPDLLELLTRGPVEAAAVLLQTHPFVIDELRQRLAGERLDRARQNGDQLRPGSE